MNNYIIFIIIGILCFACNGNKTPELDKIRKENSRVYQEGKEAISAGEPPPDYQPEPCKPCDTRFVAEILENGDIDPAEIENLICINTPECTNNVEFRQMYNEAIFKALEQNPVGFMEAYTKPELNMFKSGVAIEILNPIHDGLDAKSILNSAYNKMEASISSSKAEGLAELEKLIAALEK